MTEGSGSAVAQWAWAADHEDPEMAEVPYPGGDQEGTESLLRGGVPLQGAA